MGLKTTNYEAKEFGIVLPTAYARLTRIGVDVDGEAYGTFEIHQNREDIDVKSPFERQFLNCKVDKDLPIHRQMYKIAKEELFIDWEDDIVEEDNNMTIDE